MDSELNDLFERLRQIEEEFEQKIDEQRAAFRYRLDKGRVIFEQSVVAEHIHIKTGLIRFLRDSTMGYLLLSPFIYILILPLMLLDFSVWLFQVICFSVWGIERVRRSDYIHLDRRHLAYLNAIEKLNCEYCGYANGLIAYVREVAGRTEQYWCPIKHALRIKSPHGRYRRFMDYGDTAEFHMRLEHFRDQLRRS